MGTRNPPPAVLAVALILLGACLEAAAATDFAGDPGQPGFEVELSLSIGNAFARAGEGRHGGLHLGLITSLEMRGWIGGAQFAGIGEFEVMPPNQHQPLERYRYAGAFAGRRFRYRALSLDLGLGGGVLSGTRRTRLLREYRDCGFRFFGCPEEEAKLYREYDSESFAEPAFHPLVRSEVRISRYAALGLLGQAYITEPQGLGTIAAYVALRL